MSIILRIVGFFAGPFGMYAAIGLGVLAAVAFIDRRATYRERGKCQAAVIQSKLNAAHADLAAERDARARDQKDAAELAAEKQKTESENETLKAEIAKLPVVEQCIITPDRAKRLLR
jgi:hypothetical protein